MRPSSVFSTPLIIATMAFAVVAFLFLIDTAINHDATRQNANSTVTNRNSNMVACTDEAKLCPDGSAVGRTGPDCAFAECPGTKAESTDVVDSANSNVHIYTSSTLGLRFRYWSSPEEKNGVLEKDNKIYVYYYNANQPSNPEDGQWVEMFEKDPKISLTDAITAKFLTGRSPDDCYAKTSSSTKPEGWDYAVIGFPLVENDQDPWWVAGEKCPAQYTATNWIGYFAMNKQHPEKFYFFSIGQYAISGTDQQTPWQNTIETVIT